MMPTLNDAYHTLMTRPTRSPGTARNRNESRPAKNTAEPAPPAPRNTTSNGKVGATAAKAVVAPTTTAPTTAAPRSPKRSMITPANGSVASRVTEKAAISTPTASRLTPKDRAYRGRMGDTIPNPIMITNVPTTAARISGIRRMSRYPSSPGSLTPGSLRARSPGPDRPALAWAPAILFDSCDAPDRERRDSRDVPRHGEGVGAVAGRRARRADGHRGRRDRLVGGGHHVRRTGRGASRYGSRGVPGLHHRAGVRGLPHAPSVRGMAGGRVRAPPGRPELPRPARRGRYLSQRPTVRRSHRRRGDGVLPATRRGDGGPRDHRHGAQDGVRPLRGGRAPPGPAGQAAGRGGSPSNHGDPPGLSRRAGGDGARGLGPHGLYGAAAGLDRLHARRSPAGPHAGGDGGGHRPGHRLQSRYLARAVDAGGRGHRLLPLRAHPARGAHRLHAEPGLGTGDGRTRGHARGGQAGRPAGAGGRSVPAGALPPGTQPGAPHVRGRNEGRRSMRRLVLGGFLVLAFACVTMPSALAAAGPVTLSASAGTIDFGCSVGLTGQISPPAGGQAVDIVE